VQLTYAVTDNDTRIDTIEGQTGIVFSDNDGTYTDMSAISSTELGTFAYFYLFFHPSC
jgi:hypothetical protein